MKKLLILLIVLFPFNVKAFTSNAKGAILMDMDSGRVLYSKNPHYVQSVASISNIMTTSGQPTQFAGKWLIFKHIV